MPWSPLKYTEQIFLNLKELGYEYEVSTAILHREIMRETQLVRSSTIKNVVKAFEKLNYIRQKTSGVWEIRYWKLDRDEEPEIPPSEVKDIDSMTDYAEEEEPKKQEEMKQEVETAQERAEKNKELV